MKANPGDMIVFIDTSYIKSYGETEVEVVPCPADHKDNYITKDRVWVYLDGQLCWLYDNAYEVVATQTTPNAKCKDCRGTGRIKLFTSDVDCDCMTG